MTPKTPQYLQTSSFAAKIDTLHPYGTFLAVYGNSLLSLTVWRPGSDGLDLCIICFLFKGHAGEETVDYVKATLPNAVKEHLSSALLANADGGSLSSTTVSDILIKAITQVDDKITQDILDLFPGGLDSIATLSEEQIDSIVNDFESGGENNAKVMLGMRGSTALVSLVDPSGDNLWVASLGDCQAGTYIP